MLYSSVRKQSPRPIFPRTLSLKRDTGGVNCGEFINQTKRRLRPGDIFPGGRDPLVPGERRDEKLIRGGQVPAAGVAHARFPRAYHSAANPRLYVSSQSSDEIDTTSATSRQRRTKAPKSRQLVKYI